VCHKDIGAVISASHVDKYSVTRANTMAHQKVMEEVMKDYPLLPVRFGTIGEESDQIREKVLKGRYGELKELLTYMEDKIELGLKILWADREAAFQGNRGRKQGYQDVEGSTHVKEGKVAAR